MPDFTLTLTQGTADPARLDLAPYLRVAEGDGLDPADGDFLTPAFSELATLDGSPVLNVAAQNKELAFPLHLRAASKDALHALVQMVRRKLDQPGLLVKWQDADATLPTFYDLEYGRFELDYRYFRARQKVLSGVLRLYVRPFGHTATTSLVATGLSSLCGMAQITVPPIAGDVGGLAHVTATLVSSTFDRSGLLAVSVLPTASYTPRFPAASNGISGVATLVGASGAAGSQYLARGATQLNLQMYVANFPAPSAMAGANRVFALARHSYGSQIFVEAKNTSTGTSLTGAPVPFAATAWALVDLGMIRVPEVNAADQAAGVSIYMTASTGVPAASFPFHLNEVYVLPDSTTAAVVVELEGAGDAFTVDGVSGRVAQKSNVGFLSRELTGRVRGVVPRVVPAATVGVAVLHAPLQGLIGDVSPANIPVSVEVRVRERFSFQR